MIIRNITIIMPRVRILLRWNLLLNRISNNHRNLLKSLHQKKKPLSLQMIHKTILIHQLLKEKKNLLLNKKQKQRKKKE